MAGAGRGPAFPAVTGSSQTKPEWGREGDGWDQGAWESCSESLAPSSYLILLTLPSQ